MRNEVKTKDDEVKTLKERVKLLEKRLIDVESKVPESVVCSHCSHSTPVAYTDAETITDSDEDSEVSDDIQWSDKE